MASSQFNKTHLLGDAWSSNITLPYTAPSDGFINIYINPSSASGGSVVCYVGNAPVGVTSATGSNASACCPIKAGEQVTKVVESNVSVAIRFRSFNG